MTKEKRKTSFIESQTELSALIVEKFRAFGTKKFTVTTLNTSIGGSAETKKIVKQIVYSLVDQGFIIKVPEGKYILNSSELPSYTGKVDMLVSGAMYVNVEGLEKDIFVTSNLSGNALNGDTVEVMVTHTRKNGTMEGRVNAVIERSKKRYVGVLELGRGYAFVKADSRKMPMDIFIPLKDDNTEYKNAQKVAVEIIEWAKGDKNPTGRIVDVFGLSGDNDAEMHAILAEYDLPYKFEKEVEQAANKISSRITKKEIALRKDYRNVVTVTIDPVDAKDFDDALSLQKLENGNWELGVHIADVTHYVKPGSIIDTEAENRATSVYLVDRTVPMLPERLSNGLCSLRPNEEKYCFSAIFELDQNAEVVSEWIGRTVICSDRRFAYAEAQEIIETGKGDFAEEVLAMHTLAQLRRKARFENGAISFEREEAKFDLDEKGKPLGVFFKVQKEANQLVEEFMLLANCRVAEYIGKKKGRGKNAERTFVYRVHDKPNTDKLSRFSSFILRFGYYFKTDKEAAISRNMNKLMAEIKGKSEENLISTLAIRTMAKATYTTENIGHYGLSFSHYTHFTSPIRRYPDMMVHRLLALYMDGAKSQDKDTYESLCEHSSEMEVKAADAERASIKYKMVEFMLDHLGEEFAGHISGVTEWGLYVELDDTHIEGFVSMRDLTNDYYTFSEDDYAIIGERTGKRYTLGDPLRIEMLRGDLARKQIDFKMVGEDAPQENEKPLKNSKDKPKASKGRLSSRPRRDKKKSKKK